VRIRGRIIEASDDSVTKAGSHSLLISPDQELTIKKGRWTESDTRILNSSASSERRFILVALDRREAGVGILSGSHLTIVSTIESGAAGKGPAGSKEVDLKPYFGKVMELLKSTWREGDSIVVAGPGNTKLTVDNLVKKDPELKKGSALVEGFDLSGTDGVRALVKFEGFRKVAKDSVLVEVQEVVEEAIRRISRGERRIAYTLPRVSEAARAGAVETCVMADDVFNNNVDEGLLVQTLNVVEERGGRVFLTDSSLETGKQVSALGGIVALLRYDIQR
jgi:protein pelota